MALYGYARVSTADQDFTLQAPEGEGGTLTAWPASTPRSQTGRTMPCHGPRSAAAPWDRGRWPLAAAAPSRPGVNHAAPPADPHVRVQLRDLGCEDGA